tara:strand:+ start:19 stop:654 length:636 start_codon:yes stop_codon:yes gene_type:complete
MSRARTLANFVGGTSTIVGNPTFTGTTTGAGKLIQVKQTVFKGQFTDSISTNGHEEVVTGLNCAITPASASNKILVEYTIFIGAQTFYDIGINVYKNVSANSGAHPLGTKLLDSSGNAIEGNGTGSRPSSVGVANLYGEASGNVGGYMNFASTQKILDHPNTTSALTYSIALRHYTYDSSAVYVNRSHYFQQSTNLYDHCPVSVLTLMEIS